MSGGGYPVEFVGAGPGAADLLTVRATHLISQADVVLYPGTYLDHAVLENCSPTASTVDTQFLDLDSIVARIVEAQRSGLRVLRLVSGDPSLYSAVSEQVRRLDAAGVAWAITPGVSAYAAAAARVGHELTVPLVTQSVVLTRTQQQSTVMPESESLAAFAATGATLVLHLAITRTRELMMQIETTHGPDCPVVVVYRVSQPQEIILRGTVADIADRVEAAGLRQAAVILVGRALSERANPCAGESHLYDARRDRSHLRRQGTR
ncbi:cobalt-precorrin-4/precorrin-4 C(11)-methyltransferase [Mycolicibacterium goodii]|uniref:Precorrin-4 C11-methyltransferase n=1 Tax=Mycolicibacterium goodii TaxID=134601 RepID=A0A0K0XGH0_MYCGD|nr:precorrin-4 C11-methyltransferase [Mycolicibacterium goodii]